MLSTKISLCIESSRIHSHFFTLGHKSISAREEFTADIWVSTIRPAEVRCLSEVIVMPKRCLSLTMAFVPHLSLDPFSGNNIIRPLQRVLTTTEGGNPINRTILRKETGFLHTVIEMVESREYLNQYYLMSLLRTWTVGLRAISAR